MKNPKQCILLGVIVAGTLLAGCVQKPDCRDDEALKLQAWSAYKAGNLPRAKALIAQADKLYVPQAQLWRRTLDLRVAEAEGSPKGEVRHLLQAWAEQRTDWSVEDVANAELALAETLRRELAVDWLYDLDVEAWPKDQRTQYNTLLSRLQSVNPTARSEAVVRGRLGIRGIYEAGDVARAAREALQCARETRDAPTAILAAKLYNELGNEPKKSEMLNLAVSLSEDEAIRRQADAVCALPLGTPAQLSATR